MKKTKRILIFGVVCFVLAMLSLTANAENTKNKKIERLPFERDNFGITLGTTFKFDNHDMNKTIYAYGFHVGPGTTSYTHCSKTSEVGVGLFYNWHPLMKPDLSTWYDRFFLRFDIAGQIVSPRRDSYESLDNQHKYFLLNTGVSIGYTFKFNKVGLDIYAGLLGRFGTKRRSIEFSGKGYQPVIHVDYSYDGNIKWFDGGLSSTIGIGLNWQHVGLRLEFDNPLGYFYRATRTVNYTGIFDENYRDQPGYENFPVGEQKWTEVWRECLKDRSGMTITWLYRF